MGFLDRFYRRPQQLWIRQLIFQLHLWTGIVLALYVIVIGVTGSALVFRSELEHVARPWPWPVDRLQPPRATVGTVIRNVEARYPRWRLISIEAPTAPEPGFIVVLQARTRIQVACDQATGAVLGELAAEPRWLRIVLDLHETLLFGAKGRMANGIGGLFLVLMSLTGLVLWWPGVKNWRRGFLVDFGRSWQRINFDLHSAIGFWTLLLISFWGTSGLYFAFSRQIITWVNTISPIVNSKPPRISVEPQDSDADVTAMVSQTAALDPGAKWKGIRLPFGPRAPLQVVMGRPGGEGSDYEDILFFDPYTGRYLGIWRWGISSTFGDWLIWIQGPIHFGTCWGLTVKILWAALGLSIPILAVTGILMYWNRALKRKWKRLREHRSGLQHAPTRRAVIQSAPALLLGLGRGGNERTYVVGSTATGVPFSFLDLKTNQPAGAMIEIVKAIAADAGIPVEIRVTSFSALIPSLTSRKIDIISAGMLKTAAREKVVAFSQPVFSYGGGLVVPVRDKKEYQTLADLKGMTVGVQVGTRFYEQLQASGAREIKTYDNLMDMLMDLSTRRIEAAYGDAPIFAYQMAQARMRAARLVKSFHPPSLEDVCLVVRRNDSDLLTRINASVVRIRATQIRPILDRWSLT